jgi:hypothetical protein
VHLWQVKRGLNWANLSTPLGLLVARTGRASVGRGPRGLIVASGYRRRFPAASAFTVGNVVLTRHRPGWLLQRPRLVAHEERHTWQYAAVLGLPLLPLYTVAAGASWLLARDFASYNPFERLAGLADGGYGQPRLRFSDRGPT